MPKTNGGPAAPDPVAADRRQPVGDHRPQHIVEAVRDRPGATYGLVVIVAMVAFLGDWLGDRLGVPPSHFSVIRPAMAVALAAVWLFGARIWPGVWLGLLLGNLDLLLPVLRRGGDGHAVGAVLVIAAVGTAQVLLTAVALRRLVGPDLQERAQNVLGFAGIVTIAGLLTPTVGILSLNAAGLLQVGTIAHAWQSWWWGDVVGMIVFTPFLLAWLSPPRQCWQKTEKQEAVVALVLLVALGWVVFYGPWTRKVAVLPYMVLPVLLWIALHLGRRGTTTALLLVTVLATWGTAQGWGAFAQGLPVQTALLVLQGFIGVVSITFLTLTATVGERRAAERAFQENEAMIRRLFEAAPDAFVVADAQGRILRLNSQAETMFGYDRAELLGQPLERLTTDRYREPLDGRSLRSRLEIVARRKDGSEFPVEIMLSPLDTESGRLVIAILRDITERKRAETDLQYERQLLRQLMDHVPDKIYFKDTQSRFVQVNRAMGEYAGGRGPADLLGKTDFDVFSEEHARQAYEDEQEVMRTGQPIISKEEKETWPDGHVTWASTTKLPWRDADGRIIGTFGISREITARKVVEEEVGKLHAELEKRARELEAANKELEAFSYSVSHDLRAPLRALEGFSRLLLTSPVDKLSEDSQRYLRYINENAVHMAHLIEDLLTFSRLGRQGLRIERVNPAVVVRQCLDQLAPEQERRRVDIRIGALPACDADPAMLKQVYMNLLSNALKFTRRRAEAVIEVGALENFENTGQRVYFVRDNGVGFDMRYVDKLFGVFQRLHRPEEYEGTGVGLALVQRIIHRHGGRIWARAEVGNGATFYFTLGTPPQE